MRRTLSKTETECNTRSGIQGVGYREWDSRSGIHTERDICGIGYTQKKSCKLGYTERDIEQE